MNIAMKPHPLLVDQIVEPVLEDLRAAQRAILEHPFRDEESRVQFATAYLGESEAEVRQALGEISLLQILERTTPDPAYKALHRAADTRRPRLKVEILRAFRLGHKQLDKHALASALRGMGIRTAEEAGHVFHGNQWTTPHTERSAKDLAARYAEIHNAASKAYKAAFAHVGARLWHDDHAHPLKPANIAALAENFVGKTSKEIARFLNLPHPLTVLDSFPNVTARDRQKLEKEVAKIHREAQVNWERVLHHGLKTAEAVGHPFHGNQYTDIPDGRWVDGATVGEGMQATGPGALAILNALPDRLIADSSAKTIQTFKTVGEVSGQAQEYLLKHYGLTAPVGDIKGMVDTDRHVVMSLASKNDILTQLSKTFEARAESAEWQRLAREHGRDANEMLQDAFLHAFATVSEMANPVSFGIAQAAELFKKWGWV